MIEYKKSQFKHKANVFNNSFTTKGQSIFVNEDLRVIIPNRYVTKGLAILGSTVKTVSIFAVVNNKNEYGVILAPIFIELCASLTQDIMVDDEECIMLEFEKGSLFTSNNMLVKQATFMYNVFNEFYIKGNIPWYMDRDMISSIMLESKKYADSNVGQDALMFEIITAIICRDANDRKVYYRQVMKSRDDKREMVVVGLSNYIDAYDNTSSKLIGGYFNAGVMNSLINKEKETTKFAKALRE